MTLQGFREQMYRARIKGSIKAPGILLLLPTCGFLMTSGIRGARAADPPPATTFSVVVKIAQTDKGVIDTLTLNGSFQSPSDFDNPITISGSGQTVDKNGAAVAIETSVEVSVPPCPVNVLSMRQNEYVVTFSNSPAELFHLASLNDDGMRATLYSPERRTLATLNLPAAITAAVPPQVVARWAAGALHILLGVGGTEPPVCAPTYAEAHATAMTDCAVSKSAVCDFQYSCKSATVKMEWHCRRPPCNGSPK